ncbi:MAG TPA: hypothetical protein VFV87_06530, partial [Pirellulaceae bacterium]|nr:hypothetical protein [Pirellulaceae bacterium]
MHTGHWCALEKTTRLFVGSKKTFHTCMQLGVIPTRKGEEGLTLANIGEVQRFLENLAFVHNRVPGRKKLPPEDNASFRRE